MAAAVLRQRRSAGDKGRAGQRQHEFGPDHDTLLSPNPRSASRARGQPANRTASPTFLLIRYVVAAPGRGGLSQQRSGWARWVPPGIAPFSIDKRRNIT